MERRSRRRAGSGRDFPGYATIMAGMKKHAYSCPALLFFGIPHGLRGWVDNYGSQGA